MVVDIHLICRECRGSFLWTVGEQEFFAARGYEPPKRCATCRRLRRAQLDVTDPIRLGLPPDLRA